MKDVKAYRVVYRFRDVQAKRWVYMCNWFWSDSPQDFLRTKLTDDAEVLFYAEARSWHFGSGQWHGSPFDGKISAKEAKNEHARYRYEQHEAQRDALHKATGGGNVFPQEVT